MWKIWGGWNCGHLGASHLELNRKRTVETTEETPGNTLPETDITWIYPRIQDYSHKWVGGVRGFMSRKNKIVLLVTVPGQVAYPHEAPLITDDLR